MTQKEIQALCRKINASPWQQSVLQEELGNPYHTGTPTEWGLYLVQYTHGGYDVVLFDPLASGWDIYSDDSPKDIVAWQKIESFEASK